MYLMRIVITLFCICLFGASGLLAGGPKNILKENGAISIENQ